jgi:phosphate transport system protein
MRTIFTAELSLLAGDLVEMSEHVQIAIHNATKALANKDLELAQSVIAEDANLDALENRVDERCVLLIAQQQPVGLDLRTLVTSLRISAGLERMGDLAQHIAEGARRAYPNSPIPASHKDMFRDMSAAACQVSDLVVKLLKTRDLNVAAQIASDDDTLDDLHAKAYAKLLASGYKGGTQETLDVALLARFFERFGDHAVNVSRRVVYLVTGDAAGDRSAI